MNDPDKQSLLAELAADQRLAPAYDYWVTLAGDDVPAFSQFDPAALPAAVLGYLTLLDAVDGGSTFRVRLVGAGTTAAVGHNAAGSHVGTIAAGDIQEAALARYRAVIAHRRPVADIVEYAIPHGPRFKTRILTLPFLGRQSVIDRLLGVYSPTSAPMAQRALPNLAVPSNARVHRTQIIL